ncbi:MAG: DUF1559 domain-containing protein [Candidatus Ratteibacteria bacterium]
MIIDQKMKKNKFPFFKNCFKNAFTLIELLITIVIIFILTAIIFPAISKVREKARRAICMNNLKQIGLAFFIYIQDNDDYFPAYQDPFPEGYWLWMGRGWRKILGPYFAQICPYSHDKIKERFSKLPCIFLCPSDRTAPIKWESTSYAYSMSFYHSPEQINQMTDKSYTYDPNKIMPTIGQKFSKVRYPSQKILVGEWLDNHTGGNYGWWSWAGGRNYLFVDGHVEFIKAKEILPANDGFPNPNLTKDGILGKDIEK